jgi:hypothetical protein
VGIGASGDEALSSLPGIHEMFPGARGPSASNTVSPPPPLSTAQQQHFVQEQQTSQQHQQQQAMPTIAGYPLNALPASLASIPGMAALLSNVSSSGSGPLPADLQPVPVVPPSVSAASVNEASSQQISQNTNMPSLDQVTDFYVNQGAIFKCNHCAIIFMDRGMYFLHSSLHSAHNPWVCSICNKKCKDRNDFTLHFVNQPHSS